jgi:hypothetical protein
VGALFRAGAELERADITLAGAETDGNYFIGEARRAFERPAFYVEAERRVRALRFAPGVRVVGGQVTPGGAALVEPRLGVRWQFNDDVSLTVGASRDHQVISGLRDERTVVPGPPLWFVHPAGAPVSRSDAVTAELTAWAGRGWNVTVGAYDRVFSDVPHWRPAGVRDLSSMSYDGGRGVGAELGIRRFGDRISGWLGYGLSRVRFTDAATGERYDAVSDRRHAVSGAAIVRLLPRLLFSAQATYGTGTPVWPLVQDVQGPRFEPFPMWGGGLDISRPIPVWGDTPIRMPAHARIDVGVRRPFLFRGSVVEPYLNIQNAMARSNVVYYHAGSKVKDDIPTPVELQPVALPFTILPTLGIDVRF